MSITLVEQEPGAAQPWSVGLRLALIPGLTFWSRNLVAEQRPAWRLMFRGMA